jgi:hypothetical protein
MAKKATKKVSKKPLIVEIDTMELENKEVNDAVIPPIKEPEKKASERVITVDYFGRIGNQLFQYFFGRIMERATGAKLITSPPEFFHEIIHEKSDAQAFGVIDDVGDYNYKEKMSAENTSGYIKCHGYFQRGTLFSLYQKIIKEMIKLPPIHKNTQDIVVHLRLTDYFWHRNKWVISPKWYIQQIRKEKYRNCYIVVEPHPTNKEYLRYFDGIKGIKIVTGNSARDDFEFIRSFDRIICSNSTFCWWAAFLSEASKIYTFKPWIRDPKVSLQYIPNGIAVDGEFFRIKKLENLDWTDYWKK